MPVLAVCQRLVVSHRPPPRPPVPSMAKNLRATLTGIAPCQLGRVHKNSDQHGHGTRRPDAQLLRHLAQILRLHRPQRQVGHRGPTPIRVIESHRDTVGGSIRGVPQPRASRDLRAVPSPTRQGHLRPTRAAPPPRAPVGSQPRRSYQPPSVVTGPRPGQAFLANRLLPAPKSGILRRGVGKLRRQRWEHVFQVGHFCVGGARAMGKTACDGRWRLPDRILNSCAEVGLS